MKKALFALAVSLSIALPSLADEAPWGPVVGRTGYVAIERRQYGDVIPTIGQFLRFPGDPIVRTVISLCSTPDFWVCEELRKPVPYPSWQWSRLHLGAKQALTFLLGYCPKRVAVATYISAWGESVTYESWSCADTRAAECVAVSGVLSPQQAVTYIEPAIGCMY